MILHCLPDVYLTLRRTSRFFVGTAPLMSTLTLPDVMHMTPSPRAFPLSFCILQAIKNWRLEQPGNEATLDYGLDCGQKFGVVCSSMLTVSL